ncbi:LysE family translocator [Pandoraea sp. SD6-2]|uniref:LysE family translocator n=1 Tax=Pandoraea sp. SD6-2 TaxID=1286093 RepID=UPI0003307775|nr:LysE family translocator [Pandoraea sp. SD6-2]EON13018.1 hypothetical protein C266_13439 [Pandoraea sp. SD6-2]
MIDLSLLPFFLTAVAVLVAIPGPTTIYISTTSASQGFRFGLASCFGVMLATLVHVSFAAAGLTALLLASPLMFTVTKSLGAGYLIYIGIKVIRSRAAPASAAAQPPAGALGASMKNGFLVNLLNPKTGLFIAAFLPQFVTPLLGHVPLQIVTLGLLLVLVGAVSDIIYAALARAIGLALANRSRRPGIGKYVAGLLYMGLGVAALATSNGTSE